jgi:hypothetical protein
MMSLGQQGKRQQHTLRMRNDHVLSVRHGAPLESIFI